MIVVLLPLQTDVEPDVATFGDAFTATATVLVAVHPAVVPVTVYVMFDSADVMTLAPLVAFSPVAGAHA